MVRHILLFFTLIFSPLVSYSSHVVAGDITWECVGGGQYIFKLTAYRDCNDNALANTATLNVWNHPNIQSINVTEIETIDITPECTDVAGSPGPNDCASGGVGTIQKKVYESNAITLAGVPPNEGWVFTWGEGNRNGSISNITNPETSGLTIRSILYPITDMNNGECYENSPQLAHDPVMVVCSGNQLRYSPGATDADFDSLTYSFDNSFRAMSVSAQEFNPPQDPQYINWSTGYSATSPFPSQNQDPNNEQVTLDSETGQFTMRSFTQGLFVYNLKVTAWRCGQRVSEIYRDAQLTVANCSAYGNNTPPFITPPFNGATSFETTVTAGESVSFTLNTTDNEFLQDGTTLQSNIISASGVQFGDNFTNQNAGCPEPPCATLSNPLPHSQQGGVSITFNWQTDCAHIRATEDCYQSSEYYFSFFVQDDFCPIPATNVATVKVTIEPPEPLPAVDPICINVNDDGSTQLTWSPIDDDPQNAFENYQVFSSESNGNNFQLVANLPDMNADNFIDNNVDANEGPVLYNVHTQSICNEFTYSEESYAISSIFLEAEQIAVGVIELNWNHLAAPPPEGSADEFLVQKRHPHDTGPWETIGTTSQTTYIDTNYICTDSIGYRVVLENNLHGCNSTSNAVHDLFENRRPFPAHVYYLTVDTATGDASLAWDENNAPHTVGYIVWQEINLQNMIIDTIWGANDTTYTNTNSNANFESEKYGIAVLDSCGDVQVMINMHTTVFVETNHRICDREVDLNWTPYTTWEEGVKEYHIYASENGQPSELIGMTNSETLNFTHEEITPNSNYCYHIEAISHINGIKSLSNKTCLNAHYPPTPEFLYLSSASVEGENRIEMRYIYDENATLSKLEIFRKEVGVDEEMKLYDSFGQGGINGNFIDTEVNPNSYSYQYELIGYDSCGTPALESNIGKTVLLRGYADNNNLVNIITWSDYRDWDGNVQGYEVYRSVEGVFDPDPVGFTQVRTFEDNVEEFMERKGEFCYYIRAVENNNSFGFSEESFSNVICVYQEPIIWVPNAMMVGGYNDVFQPVASYVNFQDYYFTIMNRWGQKVFETNDFHKGWDGKANGDFVQEGVYAYMIRFVSAEGQEVIRKGTITVLRADE